MTGWRQAFETITAEAREASRPPSKTGKVARAGLGRAKVKASKQNPQFRWTHVKEAGVTTRSHDAVECTGCGGKTVRQPRQTLADLWSQVLTTHECKEAR